MTAEKTTKLIVPTLALAFAFALVSSAHAQVINASGLPNASGVSPVLTETVSDNGTVRTQVITQNTPNYGSDMTTSSSGNTSENTSGVAPGVAQSNTTGTTNSTDVTNTTGTTGTSVTGSGTGSTGTTNTDANMTGTTGTTVGTSDSTGLPNTGVGGNAAAALAIIASSLAGVALGSIYFTRKYVS